MSKEHEDVNDLKNVEESNKEVEKEVEVEKKVEKEVPLKDLGSTKPKTKMNIPLVTVSALVLGALALYGGSALGNMLGTPDDVSPEDVIETTSDGTTAIDGDTEEVAKWTASPLIDGEPKLNQEDVIDRNVAPWNDNYKQVDTNLDYLTAEEFEAKIESGERFVIYVGRATCPYCHEYRQLQDKSLANLDETIYSIDTEYYMDNEKIAELRANLGVEFVPDVVVIEDGKAVTHLPEDIQVSSVDELSKWFEGVLK